MIICFVFCVWYVCSVHVYWIILKVSILTPVCSANYSVYMYLQQTFLTENMFLRITRCMILPAVFEISHNRQETGLVIGIYKTHAVLSPFKDPTLASDQKHLFEICFLHHRNGVYQLRSSLFKQLNNLCFNVCVTLHVH